MERNGILISKKPIQRMESDIKVIKIIMTNIKRHEFFYLSRKN